MEPTANVQTGSASLPEVHGSVDTRHGSLLKRLLAFLGPAYLVSVGYMDPGNWATDLEGGARFGYQLLWVLVMSNLMAILLQTLSARLGIVSGRDLAQACRESFPRPVSWALWILCEVAIAAMDLAEVLGAAIALNLLFGLPLLIGVVLTAADTLLILWLTRYGIRLIEGLVLLLVGVIGGCFFLEILLARPDLSQVAGGLVPRLNAESLFVAIGILGATVMPHNLYLHSALVQTRRFGQSEPEKRTACRYNLLDSVLALNMALLVNAAILVLSATVFHARGQVVTEIQQAHELLSPLLGTTLASTLFAVALLSAGQSSTVTGTMAGQIVMEGFLNFRMQPWLRRLITRMVAVVPAVLTIHLAGEGATYRLLILSQVVLSLQLPFAVIPLIHFTSDRRRMGTFANRAWVQVLAWLAAAVIVGLNLWLVANALGALWERAGEWRWAVALLVYPLGAVLLLLLLYVTLQPVLPRWMAARDTRLVPTLPLPEEITPRHYRHILVTLDHTDLDTEALSHAGALAQQHGSRLSLVHVEVGVTSQVYGAQALTDEVQAGRDYLEGVAAALRRQGLDAEVRIEHAYSPSHAIIRLAKELRPDLIIMGAHGHGALKDLVFGNTINKVRHELKIPVLVVR